MLDLLLPLKRMSDVDIDMTAYKPIPLQITGQRNHPNMTNWYKRIHVIFQNKVKQSAENHQLTKIETSPQRQFDVTIEGRQQLV